ncbi:MAG: ATP-binding cassette domain-containing protein [Candidatus Spyradocola sp.]|jgi:ABC-2 type transport system ATP-binding protein
MLEWKNVEKTYGSQEALRGVNLALQPGEIVGLFGENGAGKTTLLKCALGLVRCKGEVLLDGERITGKNIGRLSFATVEHSFFPTLNARAHAAFYAEQFGKFDAARFHELLDFFHLPQEKPARALSVGQKNQLEVSLALCQGADYILMDEPFAGNDVFNREDFYKLLLGLLTPRETVLLATHLIEEVQNFVGRAVLLRNGQVLADLSSEDWEREGLLQTVKSAYGYREDRVRRALQNSLGEEE